MNDKGPKETAFHEEIETITTALRELCEKHKINMALYLALDAPMPNTVMQIRNVKINDPEDLVGTTAVLKIWDAIREGEKTFDERYSKPTEEGN